MLAEVFPEAIKGGVKVSTTELRTVEAAELQVPEVLLDIFAGRVLPPAVDAAALNERITRAMLAAETPEQALAAGATVSFEDGLMGKPIEVRDVVLRPSTLKGEVKVFALIDGYDLGEGLEATITCSAMQVMRTLVVYKLKGWLPATFVVEKSDTSSADGFTPYTIRAA